MAKKDEQLPEAQVKTVIKTKFSLALVVLLVVGVGSIFSIGLAMYGMVTAGDCFNGGCNFLNLADYNSHTKDLVLNSGFEIKNYKSIERWDKISNLPLNVWGLTDTVSPLKLSRHSGNLGLKVDDSSDDFTESAVQIIKAEPNTKYILSAYAKELDRGGYASLYLDFLNKDKNRIEEVHTEGGFFPGQWGEREISAISPKNTEYIRVILYSSLKSKGIVYWDDVNLVSKAANSRYFTIDGKTQFFIGGLYLAPDDEIKIIRTKEAAGGVSMWSHSFDRSDNIQRYKRIIDKAVENKQKILILHIPIGLEGHIYPDIADTNNPVTIDGVEKWMNAWDEVFEYAERRGVYVMPNFAFWVDWLNKEMVFANNRGYGSWEMNAFSAGKYWDGPCKNVIDILDSNSKCQKSWMDSVNFLVSRLEKHKNIISWYLFDELQTVWGYTPIKSFGVNQEKIRKKVLNFMDTIHYKVSSADTSDRIVGPTLVDEIMTEDFCGSGSIGQVAINFYPGEAAKWDLVPMIIKYANLLKGCKKPVVISAGGLDAVLKPLYPLDVQSPDFYKNAHIAYRQGIWTAMMSNYASASLTYWLDSSFLDNDPKDPWRALRIGMVPVFNSVAKFSGSMDFSDKVMLNVSAGKTITAVSMGDSEEIIGYVRDNLCVCDADPDSPVVPDLSNNHPLCPTNWESNKIVGEKIIISAPSNVDFKWNIKNAIFYDAVNLNVIHESKVVSSGNKIELKLPDFKGDLVFKIR